MKFVIPKIEPYEYETTRICLYCEKSCNVHDSEHVLCTRKGIVANDFVCNKFIYDPLKRTYPSKKALPTYVLPNLDENEETTEI